MIALLIIVLAVGSPAVAKCCSLGGGASYNFLGDSAVDISMDEYDEFVRENVPSSIVAVPDVKKAATSRMHLNMLDNSSIYLLLTQTEGSISGMGNETLGNVTEPVEVVGMLQANKLSLDVTAFGGDVYKFNLAAEGSTVLGDYSLAMPDGERRNGTAEGKWEI
ncbi:MAG: hypothetical protein M0Q43_07065 [Methanothrix sp.]|jgi:hypothetical protein|nr:hypothetical protein [Methanothrix sp.]